MLCGVISRFDSHKRNISCIFELRREIFQYKQGNNSIFDHYTSLKELWDELSSYTIHPNCTCGTLNNIHINYATYHLMQFLNGLDESFAQVRS